jgi:hypothetical protein
MGVTQIGCDKTANCQNLGPTLVTSRVVDAQSPGTGVAGGSEPPHPDWWFGSDGNWYPPELRPGETPTADDWWQASDGKWYPPVFHPDYEPPAEAAHFGVSTPVAEEAPAFAESDAGSSPPPPPLTQSAESEFVEPPVESSPEKKLTRRPVFWILVVLVLGGSAIAAIVIAAGANHSATQTHTLGYSVTGTGPRANLSYSIVKSGNGHAQKGLAEEAGASVPWTKTVTASGSFTGFTLSAENGSTGTITCTITDDGKVVDTSTATGAYAIASCEVTGSS